MSKISLIIQREYLSRVKKRSFIIMTFLTPLIFASFYGMIIYFSYTGIKDKTDKIGVINQNKTLTEHLTSTNNLQFIYVDEPFETLKKNIKKSGFDYILYLPNFDVNKPTGIQLIGIKQGGLSLNGHIEDAIAGLIRNYKLKQSGISQKTLDNLKSDISIDTKKIGEGGKEQSSSAGASTIIAFVAGVLMFMFITLYGVQVMRGIIEEKTSRIVEIIISSVKPFQLMMGKIIGIALVGLTQFLLWIILTISISALAVSVFVDKNDVQKIATSAQVSNINPAAKNLQASAGPMGDFKAGLAGLDVGKITAVFIFYFLAGYLFYSALYAAIGSAVDSETETQQFMLPVMMPLLLGYALSLSVVTNNPYGNIAFWLSMIPFTSPIAMVVRLPYGVPGWQLVLSMGILILGFMFTVWLAARIYRVGILMYGKKASFKEMAKWFWFKG